MTPKQAAKILREVGPFTLGTGSRLIDHDDLYVNEDPDVREAVFDILNAIASEPVAVAKAREALLKVAASGVGRGLHGALHGYYAAIRDAKKARKRA